MPTYKVLIMPTYKVLIMPTYRVLIMPTFDGDVEVVPELPCPVVGNQAVPPTIPI